MKAVLLCNLHTLCELVWDADEEELDEPDPLDPTPDVLAEPAAEADADASPETEVPDESPPAKAAIGGPGKTYDAPGLKTLGS
jgi:hypothetical protein